MREQGDGEVKLTLKGCKNGKLNCDSSIRDEEEKSDLNHRVVVVDDDVENKVKKENFNMNHRLVVEISR